MITALLSSAHGRQIRAKRTADALILTLCLLPTLSFAWLGIYTRPSRDDFLFIGTHSVMPFWEALQHGLTNDFSVGYSFLTVKILMDPLGYSAVQIFPALLLAALFFCISALLYQALDAVGLVANKWLTAAAVGSLLLTGLYSSLQLYYFEISIKYGMPIAPVVLFVLLLLIAARQPRVQGRRLGIYALLGWALCFAATGFSETFDIVLLLALGLLLCLTLLAGGKWRQHCLPILASGCSALFAGILLILSAPGLQSRVTRRVARPGIGDRSLEEILAQATQAWIDRIGDPAALASIALMLAVGVLVGMNLPKANRSAREHSQAATRLPLLIALVSQLLLLPLIWHHQSDQPIIFGRYSAGYAYVLALNALLILGLIMLLWQLRRSAIGKEAAKRAAAYAGLAVILLCFVPTQLRDMHWRAYLYLWLSAHSLLILLGWHLSRWLRPEHVRRFTIGVGCLYVLILAGTASVALATNTLVGKDIQRTYIFLTHLFAWLGLVWGMGLGWAFRSMTDSRRWLAAGALLVVLGLSTPVVVDNVAMLPLWRQYAAEFDERLAIIIEGQAKGQRDYVFAPFRYEPLLKGPMHLDPYLLLRYDVDSITLAET